MVSRQCILWSPKPGTPFRHLQECVPQTAQSQHPHQQGRSGRLLGGNLLRLTRTARSLSPWTTICHPIRRCRTHPKRKLPASRGQRPKPKKRRRSRNPSPSQRSPSKRAFPRKRHGKGDRGGRQPREEQDLVASHPHKPARLSENGAGVSLSCLTRRR